MIFRGEKDIKIKALDEESRENRTYCRRERGVVEGEEMLMNAIVSCRKPPKAQILKLSTPKTKMGGDPLYIL